MEREKCPICLEEIFDITASNCGHLFCERCIVTWLTTGEKCPTCNKKITKLMNEKGQQVPLPKKKREPRDDRFSLSVRTAMDLQVEEVFEAVKAGVITEAEASAFLEKDEPPARRGIACHPQSALIGCFDALMKEFQGNWNLRGNHEVFSLDRAEFSGYPVFVQLVESVWSNPSFSLQKPPEIAWVSLYRENSSCSSWHMNPLDSTVVTVTVGDIRKFLIEPTVGEKFSKQLTCDDGDVVIFAKDWNSSNKKYIPKTKRADFFGTIFIEFLVKE